jgi:hypothetical protein
LVRAGRFFPSFSCTTGPVGTVGRAGGAARVVGMVRATSDPSGIHAYDAPATALSGVSSSFFALALAASPLHNRTPSSVVTVNAKRVPSGDHVTSLTRAPTASPPTTRGAALASPGVTSVSFTMYGRRLGALRRGSMRMPARRSSGREISSMPGSVGVSRSSTVLPSGDSDALGVGGTSMRSATARGGV